MSRNKPAEVQKVVDFRGGGFAPQSRRWVGALVFVVLIGLVELGTRSGFITSLTLPKPSDVFATFVDLWQSGLLWKHLIPSVSRLIIGAAIGASIGIGVGVLIGLFSLVRAGPCTSCGSHFPNPQNCSLAAFCDLVWH